MVGVADANADGKLSREEWIAKHGTAEGFAEYDLDGDGVVDSEEYRLGKEKERVAAMADGAAKDADAARVVREEAAVQSGKEFAAADAALPRRHSATASSRASRPLL